MHHPPARPKPRTTALVAAACAVLLLALAGCTSSSPSEAAAAAAAKPLSQQAFITRQLGLSSSDFGEYLRRQAFTLEAGTTEFVTAYESGDDDLARSLYAPTRSFYNRMLGAADAFPALDASLDAPGTGWHAIEAELWPLTADENQGMPVRPATLEQRQATGQQLDADTKSLSDAVSKLRPTVEQQAAGVAALMAGRATAAAAGDQEPRSHTDLYDLQAYVDGAREVFSGLRQILVTQNAALATTLDHRFDAAEGELNGLRTGVSFPGYDTLGDDQRQSLQSAVADLTASLGQVPGTLAG
ncbi:MAG: iron uptake system component EfeO [Subtercola sp.]|nr:iron uptake system component EfeO [Subtercola sp.]